MSLASQKKIKKENKKILIYFPRYFRIIIATIQKGTPFVLVIGVLIVGLLNVWQHYQLPFAVQELLKNPRNIAILSNILQQNQDFTTEQELTRVIRNIGREDIIAVARSAQSKKVQTRVQLDKFLEEHPDYAEGFAYRAVLLSEQHVCNKALEDIERAMALDPNRAEFQEIYRLLKSCR